jgi:hypothetical protein
MDQNISRRQAIEAIGAAAAMAACTGRLEAAARQGVIPMPALRALPFENGVIIVGSEDLFLRLRPTAWGQTWFWLPGQLAREGNVLSVVHECKIGEEPVRLAVRIVPVGPRRIEVSYEFTVERNFSPGMIAVSIEPGASFHGKDRVQLESPAGRATFGFPMRAGDAAKAATAIHLTNPLGTTTVRLDPGIDVSGEGGIRLPLGQGRFVPGQPRKLGVTIELPVDCQWLGTPAELPDDPGIETWFPWQPKQDVEGDASIIGMQRWLDPVTAPADRIVNRNGRLMRGDRPIRLWGINSNYAENFPEKPEATRRAAWFAKYGINCVRLHKLSQCGWHGMRSRETCRRFDPAKLDRLDFYTAELRKHGVYYAFSPNYPFTLGPEDRDLIEAFDEVAQRNSELNVMEVGAGDIIWASPKMQGLLIEQALMLLNHVNPYTGLAYKDDPALAYIECINEQSVLFYSNLPSIAKKPTYKRLLAERFSEWLKQKYGSHEALVKAWGAEALKGCYDSYPDEHLDKRNIFPGGNPWFWDPVQMAGSHKAYARRFLDHMAFLAYVQNDFYTRWADAVRKAGHQGMIEYSNWQAGRMHSHYYNLHSDAQAGLIDRHNYFGGVSGFNFIVGSFNNDSMLARPGSGSLSSGLQQVEGCAFALSEWIHCLPNEWAAEGPALIGAYGFGLQGWDMSFIFTQAGHRFPERIDGYVWNAFQPTIMGAFPAVSRQVLRGDVTEAPVISTRRVCVPLLAEGRGIDFEDTVSQSHDVKSFDCDRVPTEALARGRLVVQFTERPEPTVAPAELQDLRQAQTIGSVTGQLSWTRGAGPRDGFFTINTPATKAVVGFARDRVCRLGTVELAHHNRYAAVYLTCLDRGDTDIATARRLLVVAVARCRNQGARFIGDGGLLLDKGPGHLLVEPVSAELRIDRPGTPTVHVLDHDGRRTGRTVPLRDGRIVLNGAEHRTIYYEIAFG